MGTTNFVKSTAPSQNPVRSFSKSSGLRLNVDVPLLIAVILLLVIGLVMVYSASMQYSVRDYGNQYEVFKKQAIYVFLGCIVAYIAYRFPYQWLRVLAPYMMVGLIFLLMLVLVLPQDADIPKRTLFNGSVQPSELAKVAIVIYLSVWIGSKKEKLNTLLGGLIPFMVILGITGGLIFAQPDTSAMLTILVLGIILFFMGEGDWRVLAGIILSSMIVFGLAYLISDTVQGRINVYLVSMSDITESHDQIQHSLAAIIRGGWFGTRLGESSGKYIGLPVPWTDSIFAVILEELGFIGGAFIVMLYLVILWRGLKIAEEAPDLAGKLLAGGLTCWLIFEAFLNMGVMINLFPVAGNALPFISYGGSIMLTTLGAIGLIFSVNRSTIEYNNSRERSSHDAAVDLRGGDGRRRVSRAERSSRNQH